MTKAHIRFRAAWKANGRALDDIPFKHIFGVAGSWLGLVLVCVALVAQLFTAIAPAGGGLNNAKGFFQAYLALPVVLFFWACGYIWKRQGIRKLSEIDLDTGRRPVDWEVINAQRARYNSWPKWRRFCSAIF